MLTDYNREITLMEVAEDMFRDKGLEMTEEDKHTVLRCSYWLRDFSGYDSSDDEAAAFGCTTDELDNIDFAAIIEEVGLGLIYLTVDEMKALVRVMGEAKFRRFTGELAQFIKTKRVRVKSHYETILKWYERAENNDQEARKNSDASRNIADAEHSQKGAEKGLKATENGSEGVEKGSNMALNSSNGTEHSSRETRNSHTKERITSAKTENSARKKRPANPRHEEANRAVPGYQIKFFAALLMSSVPALYPKEWADE